MCRFITKVLWRFSIDRILIYLRSLIENRDVAFNLSEDAVCALNTSVQSNHWLSLNALMKFFIRSSFHVFSVVSLFNAFVLIQSLGSIVFAQIECIEESAHPQLHKLGNPIWELTVLFESLIVRHT